MNTRGLKPQTMNYINTAINVLKFLSQQQTSTLNLSESINTLRQVKNQLKKLIGRFKPPTSEELQEMEKW
jgi:methyl-accepting chemotaxis protein